MKASFTLRAYRMSEDTRKSAMKNKKQQGAARPAVSVRLI
jgi:hypothetical protein